ncbi:MAG: plasmid pRiA4b ORF-3 family protein [Cyanobacteriota bacterium]|nr:plasmid pRiA4b ORF-3 family protein [Cyanobacteriota bacterium]
MPAASTLAIYQLKVVLLGISPMIWRRIRVRSDSTIADLHYTIQIAMGWADEHLHQFIIHGVRYGISYMGSAGFGDNAQEVKLAQFSFREREKFIYEYDFCDYWKHQIRVEAIFPDDNPSTYPICTTGKGACPPENCGGTAGFITLRQKYNRVDIALRLAEIFLMGEIEEIAQHKAELAQLHYWLKIHEIDRPKINHQLQQYATGDEAWRDSLSQIRL